MPLSCCGERYITSGVNRCRGVTVPLAHYLVTAGLAVFHLTMAILSSRSWTLPSSFTPLQRQKISAFFLFDIFCEKITDDSTLGSWRDFNLGPLSCGVTNQTIMAPVREQNLAVTRTNITEHHYTMYCDLLVSTNRMPSLITDFDHIPTFIPLYGYPHCRRGEIS